MTDYEAVDYFFDPSLVPDPYTYYDYLRSQCPVRPATPHGVVAVTGHAEALAAYKDPAMSSCVAVAGPFPPLPFTPEGDDISAQIEAHRAEIPMAEHIVTMDADVHAKTRGLLSKLITPKRLSENEEFMWRLADQQLDTFVDKGSCEFMEDYAKPFAMLVIADLLGVPIEDHAEFRRVLGNEVVGDINESDTVAHNPLVWLDEKFREYISDRRRGSRADVLTELAAATYPDGAVPEVEEVVKLATFLFAAGMETTTKLLSTGMQVMAERPDIQQSLRDNRAQIPSFLEEALRTESPVKSHFRLARTTTNIGGVDVPAGTIIMMLPGRATVTLGNSKTRTSSSTIGATCASTWPSGGARTRAPGRRWRGRRPESRSTDSSTGWPTFGSTCRCTVQPKTVVTPTTPPSSCVDSRRCTSSSRRASRRPGSGRPAWRSTR
jgi:cytochrome P450